MKRLITGDEKQIIRMWSKKGVVVEMVQGKQNESVLTTSKADLLPKKVYLVGLKRHFVLWAPPAKSSVFRQATFLIEWLKAGIDKTSPELNQDNTRPDVSSDLAEMGTTWLESLTTLIWPCIFRLSHFNPYKILLIGKALIL